MIKNLVNIALMAVACTFASCNKAGDFEKYLASGEIRYAAKPEELKAFSGKERIKLQWKIFSDQNITYAKIYWRNKSDSLTLPIQRGQGIDTLEVIVPLAEGPYSFDVVHYHADGNRSLSANVNGNSYGERYETTLINRGVRSVSWTPSNQGIVINWGNAENAVIGTVVDYININNDARQFVALPTASSSSYTRLLQDSELSYRTMFKPDTLSIDTFYSDVNIIPVRY